MTKKDLPKIAVTTRVATKHEQPAPPTVEEIKIGQEFYRAATGRTNSL